jgi:hypothetical protein
MIMDSGRRVARGARRHAAVSISWVPVARGAPSASRASSSGDLTDPPALHSAHGGTRCGIGRASIMGLGRPAVCRAAADAGRAEWRARLITGAKITVSAAMRARDVSRAPEIAADEVPPAPARPQAGTSAGGRSSGKKAARRRAAAAQAVQRASASGSNTEPAGPGPGVTPAAVATPAAGGGPAPSGPPPSSAARDPLPGGPALAVSAESAGQSVTESAAKRADAAQGAGAADCAGAAGGAGAAEDAVAGEGADAARGERPADAVGSSDKVPDAAAAPLTEASRSADAARAAAAPPGRSRHRSRARRRGK